MKNELELAALATSRRFSEKSFFFASPPAKPRLRRTYRARGVALPVFAPTSFSRRDPGRPKPRFQRIGAVDFCRSQGFVRGSPRDVLPREPFLAKILTSDLRSKGFVSGSPRDALLSRETRRRGFWSQQLLRASALPCKALRQAKILFRVATRPPCLARPCARLRFCFALRHLARAKTSSTPAACQPFCRALSCLQLAPARSQDFVRERRAPLLKNLSSGFCASARCGRRPCVTL